MPADGIDLTRAEVFDDPHPVYDALREAAPVQWNASLRGWVLTGHADVKAALRDTRLSVEKLEPFATRAAAGAHGGLKRLAAALSDWMVFTDPPRHAALRRAMQNAFMARDMPVLEPMVERVVGQLLDEIAPPPGRRHEVDLLAAFAHPAPSIVIAELFGLPPGERGQLVQWSVALGEFVLRSTDSPRRRERAAAAVAAMSDRFRALLETCRADGRDDFTALLARDGAHLTDDEIVHTLILVLFAGHETTANLIANGLLVLLRSPGLMRRITADPERVPERVEAAIEEFLRLEGPVQMVFRLAREDVEYGGVPGARLHLVLNAANRDPAAFEAPGWIDPERRGSRHVSFGPGTHMCLGAPLARLVGRIALTGLLSRFQRFELAADALEWRRQLVVHGLLGLPVSFERLALAGPGARGHRA